MIETLRLEVGDRIHIEGLVRGEVVLEVLDPNAVFTDEQGVQHATCSARVISSTFQEYVVGKTLQWPYRILTRLFRERRLYKLREEATPGGA